MKRILFAAGCLLATCPLLTFVCAQDAATSKQQLKAKFVVYASEQDAGLRTSLFRILIGSDNAARIEKASTIEEAASSDADVLLLVMLDRQREEVTPEVLENLKKRKIIGIGYGAGQVFAALGQEINSGNCAHFGASAPILGVDKVSGPGVLVS